MKKSLKKISLLAMTSASYLAIASQVFAQGDEPGTIRRPTILPSINAGEFISGLIGLIIIVAFITAFIFLLWGGFQWITAGGDEAGITAARGRIMQALIGLTVVVAAWALFQLVQVAFGITILGANLTELFSNLFPR